MRSKPSRRVVLTLVLGLGLASTVSGQQLIIKGEFGMKGGTMAPPGIYAGVLGSLYNADQLRNEDGDAFDGPNVNQSIFAPIVQYVSTFKIFGANYAATVAVPFANTRLEFPRLGLEGSTGSLALSQTWVVPVSLGWHIEKPLFLSPGGADITAHYAFYAPTGRYTPGAPNNTSLGMWTNEVSFRVTSYFDKNRDWHGSASLFYDINSKKEGQDWTTGNAFTYMWGLGRNFGDQKKLMSGWAGLAGYAQWQVTDTTGIDAPLVARQNKTRIYGVGPELTFLQGALTLRYLWQFGGLFSTQGSGLYAQFVMPLPF